MSSPENAKVPREMLTVEQAADRLSVSRTTMFALLRNEVVPSVLVGRYRRIPAAELATYVESLSAPEGD
ncbi:helix-turn-helix domain-containing protein [Amycolatopsis roodepoortensis]|uniref:helix-turn-helix domain-containing protein n=1 Tax=Amycolatopsis roodepoortensis TaxID=700274 RepID=UPI00214C3E3B|nr:helix-turn-helix domain-containing protein [Amycolatopsis roodepoortensis]UUV34288.1 helix-turn-helix domain-containing protein [Amycolatopsis roodepoortensis]